ncbi:MAG: ribonuclease P subunit P30 [Methanobrevibacter sp.]|jgi:ribonuclease P/MRP protein subunit RPP1|nr:ribonuclease P subunit P30 [Candidatus Methanovirga basalitermitum]
MIFHDFNLRGRNLSTDLQLVNEASRLGWNHLNLVYDLDNFENFDYKEDLIENISDDNLTLGFTLELNPKSPNEIRKNINKFRKKVNFISVLGGDTKINRLTCENRFIDILSRPYFKRYDAGLNHVLVKEAIKNNVTIELCFNDILKSYSSYRSKILSNFRDVIKLYEKFKFNLIVSSRAESIFDIRSPRDIIAIFRSLGLNEVDIDNIFCIYPKNMIDFANERDKIVVLGVKEIKK